MITENTRNCRTVVCRSLGRLLASGLGSRCLSTLETIRPEFVTVVEVGPRDGLQNEKVFIPTSVKIDFINRITKSGVPRIEVTSFVSPKWVPQLRDARDVAAGIERSPTTRYTCLTPNVEGFKAALESGLHEVAIFGAASEAFSKRNINCTIDESIERFRKVTDLAQEKGVPVRGYVSCVVGCPYQGEVTPGQVQKVASQLLDLGCYEISLGDTIGVGTPESIDAMLDAVLTEIPADRLAIHCHDTHGRALDNIESALARGIRVVDAAAGGLGGCPYAGPGASGNVATETVVDRLHQIGYETGVDSDLIRAAGQFIKREIERFVSDKEPKSRL